ncbi:hypothetical protein SAMN05192574_107152 [Mucilaginibacter gossypiicola]|uniref:Uncharacterized protein n=1 Tax=Mucilaginibacter gossypiicola TaxID=551995 RepID=A0A1H8NYJ4_9SPHI|nr:hypothetical protein SAMN05192574_107152 [Mucilaginibacter gossypiicola]
MQKLINSGFCLRLHTPGAQYILKDKLISGYNGANIQLIYIENKLIVFKTLINIKLIPSFIFK